MGYHNLTQEQIGKLQESLAADPAWTSLPAEVHTKLFTELLENTGDSILDSHVKKVKGSAKKARPSRKKKAADAEDAGGADGADGA